MISDEEIAMYAEELRKLNKLTEPDIGDRHKWNPPPLKPSKQKDVQLAAANFMQRTRNETQADVSVEFEIGDKVSVKNSGRLGIITSMSLMFAQVDEMIWNSRKGEYIFLRESTHNSTLLQRIEEFPISLRASASSWIGDCVLQHNKARNDT